MARPPAAVLVWPAAALAAAAVVALSGLGSIPSAACGGIAVVLLGLALGLIQRGNWQLRANRRPLVIGACVLGLASGAAALPFPAAPALGAWLLPALAALGVLFLVHGIVQLEADEAQLELEREQLRSRLVRREGDVRAQADRIRRLDLREGATGALNRRGLARAAAECLEACAASGEPLVAIAIRIDADSGRSTRTPSLAGRLSRALARSVRASDPIGHWDDETLLLILPACREIEPALSRVRSRLDELGLEPSRCGSVRFEPSGVWPDPEGLLAAAQASFARPAQAVGGRVLPFRAAGSVATREGD